jgi:hypothetical protein
MLVAIGLAWEAWNRVAPALNDGWLSPGMAARLFLPLLILGAVSLWLWRR